MTYSHTQHAPLHWLLVAFAGVMIGFATLAPPDPTAAIMLSLLGGAFLVLALSFQHLKVEDEGDRLRVRFGPLPLFQKTIRYDRITAARPARSSVIDGWGIHWVPGRGWTWNLWGMDCVELTVGGKVLRIGTDDPEGLAEFVQGKLRG